MASPPAASRTTQPGREREQEQEQGPRRDQNWNQERDQGQADTLTHLSPTNASLGSHPAAGPAQRTVERAVQRTVQRVEQQRLSRARLTQHAAQLSLTQFLNSIPFVPPYAVEDCVPAACRRVLVKVLAARGWNPANMSLDVITALWRLVLHVFFRRIEARGLHRVPPPALYPGEGEGVLFVCAPHANQFLDPVVVSSQLRKFNGRHVTFVTAEKSWKRLFVGAFARAMQGIPVARAFDNAHPGQGTICLDPSDPLLVQGKETNFTSQLEERGQILLPKSLGGGAAAVTQVLSDTQVRIKAPFPSDERVGPNDLAQALKEGTTFTVVPHLDQSDMFKAVYERLLLSESVGVFPEGGSHDRTSLLPLKAGAALIALGALASHPELKLKVIPVGLYYFHRDQFRSRAVVEFGRPLSVAPRLVDQFGRGGEDKRAATGEMMAQIEEAVKSVVIEAPDLPTLRFVHAARRLYPLPRSEGEEPREGSGDGDGPMSPSSEKDYGRASQLRSVAQGMRKQEQRHRLLTPGQVVALSRKLLKGYLAVRTEPDVQQLQKEIERYLDVLSSFGLEDYHVATAARQARLHSRVRILATLLGRLLRLVGWTSLALPGVMLNLPIYLICEWWAKRKAREALAESTVKVAARDVLASWKVMVAAVLAPSVWWSYALLLTYAARRTVARPHAALLLSDRRGGTGLGERMRERMRTLVWATDPIAGVVPAMPFTAFAGLAAWAYVSLYWGENALDISRSLPPLCAALGLPLPTPLRALLHTLRHPGRLQSQALTFEQLQLQRADLVQKVQLVVDKYAARLALADKDPPVFDPRAAASSCSGRSGSEDAGAHEPDPARTG